MFFEAANVLDDQLYAESFHFTRPLPILRKSLNKLFGFIDSNLFISQILDILYSHVRRGHCIPVSSSNEIVEVVE